MERTFNDILDKYEWEDVKEKLAKITKDDVVNALRKDKRSLTDFLALISPVAAPYIETMAAMSSELTAQRFGKNIQLYAPLYLSNECNNICTYCGFSVDNGIRRRTLSPPEIMIEAQTVRSMGFQHILLVSGEATQKVGVDYFIKAARQISDVFPQISIEVQPLDQDDYHRLSEVN
ncbi:MAG: radical SAM protein, partial [Sphingobacterium sp.]